MKSKTQTSYDKQASDYDRRWKAYLEHTHREFLLRVLIHKNDDLLDTSCGTGLLARSLAERGAPYGKLVLNDFSAGMISIARQRMTGYQNVWFTHYPADKLHELQAPFDLVLCLNSFHYYENQQKVLQNIFDLLKPGGRLCLLDWNRAGLFRAVNFFLRFITKEELRTRSHFEMKRMLEKAGFRVNVLDTWAYRYWRFFFIEAVKE